MSRNITMPPTSRQVDVVVTTAGGIEEDLIKCLAATYKGDFSLPGVLLRSKGLNRIGNLLVPNDNYCKFEDWVIPIFDQMLKEQRGEINYWSCIEDKEGMYFPKVSSIQSLSSSTRSTSEKTGRSDYVSRSPELQ